MNLTAFKACFCITIAITTEKKVSDPCEPPVSYTIATTATVEIELRVRFFKQI